MTVLQHKDTGKYIKVDCLLYGIDEKISFTHHLHVDDPREATEIIEGTDVEKWFNPHRRFNKNLNRYKLINILDLGK